MKAPRRWLDDAALAPGLRDDLRRTAAAPCAYDAAAGLAALQLALGTGAVAIAAGAAPAAASAQTASAAAAAAPAKSAVLFTAVGAKLGLAVVATAAVVVASVLVTTERAAPRRPHAGDHATAVPARAKPGPGLAAAAAVPGEQQPAALAKAPNVPAPAQVAPVRAHGARDRARREIVQLGRVKALLERDPARALAAAQSGHRQFPRGMLRHEREGLAVLALFAIDRRTEAEQRARAFLERYPHSPLRAQIERQRDAP
jgi:hypothetical protein